MQSSAKMLWALVVVVGMPLASCTVVPSSVGRPCATDAECGAGFYCNVEGDAQVCLPGSLGLPELPNFPPIIERAVVVVALGAPGDVPDVFAGTFAARDPEGDEVAFALASPASAGSLAGALGTLEVDADGAWRFTVASPAPTSDAQETFPLEATDALGNTARADALVVVVVQPPSEFLSYWVGDAGVTSSFDQTGAWTPVGVPNGDVSVAIGPGAQGPLQIDANAEVFGWLSTSSPVMPAIALANDSLITVRGARVLSDSPFEGLGTLRAEPAGNFDVEMQLGGLLPALELAVAARLIAPTHVAGDLLMASGAATSQPGGGVSLAQTDGALRLGANLSVDGSLVQAEAGTALVMEGFTLRVGGDLVLGGTTKSFVTAGLLDVGGALDAENATFGGPNLLVRFSAPAGGAATAPTRVRLPVRASIGNAFVARGAAISLATDLVVENTLQLAGGLAIEEGVELEVDTLVVRPSFVDVAARDGAAAGELRARICLIAPFVARPAWLTCDVENIDSPADQPDGGPDVEPPPDLGAPSECTRLDADVETPEGIVGIASDNMEHGLVVVNAGGDAVSDRFVFDGLDLLPTTTAVRGGELVIEADGEFTFTPNEIAGVEGIDVAMDVGVRDDDGNAIIAGTQEACVDLQIVDPTGMNVMIGFSWDDPAAWTFGRIPNANDRVFIPASDRQREAAPTGDDLVARELYLSSGAVLYTGPRTLRVSDVVLAGGILDAPVVIGPATRTTSAVGGRIGAAPPGPEGARPSSAALVCGGGQTRLVADVDTTTLRSEAPCNFVVGQNRLTARDDVALDDALGLRMNDSFGAVVFKGALSTTALGGVNSFLNDGEIQFHGAVNVGSWLTPAARAHRTFIFGQGDLVVGELEYLGFLIVSADTEGSLTVSDGGHVGRLFALRDVSLGAELFVEELDMNPQFTTSTPELFRVAECFPRNTSAACFNPPD